MADNCPGLEPWSLPSLFTDFSDAFAGDTEALIHALQVSLSDDSQVLAAIGGGGDSPFLAKSELSVSDAETTAAKRARGNLPSPTAGKMKRKSRASKRSATTYITVDPANFRQMVQQVTGIAGPYGASAAVLEPEPRRPVGSGSNGSRVPLHLHAGSRLPTLDTSSSSSLLDRAAAARPPSHASSFESSAAAFDLGRALPCFPTLESWSTM